MKMPFLSIDVLNSNLDETLMVLQGVSRYVESIFLEEKLVENEGVDVINFLNERYPTKKITIVLRKEHGKNLFIKEIVEKTTITSFAIAGDLLSKKFRELYVFLKKSKKKIIFISDKIDFALLKKYKFDGFFFFKSEKANSSKQKWISDNFKNLKLLQKKNYFLTVGNVKNTEIVHFHNVFVNEFTVGKEVCYSFNPVETFKLIYANIKKYHYKTSHL